MTRVLRMGQSAPVMDMGAIDIDSALSAAFSCDGETSIPAMFFWK